MLVTLKLKDAAVKRPDLVLHIHCTHLSERPTLPTWIKDRQRPAAIASLAVA